MKPYLLTSTESKRDNLISSLSLLTKAIKQDVLKLHPLVDFVGNGDYNHPQTRMEIQKSANQIYTILEKVTRELTTLGVLVWEEDTLYHVLRDIRAHLNEEA